MKNFLRFLAIQYIFSLVVIEALYGLSETMGWFKLLGVSATATVVWELAYQTVGKPISQSLVRVFKF